MEVIRILNIIKPELNFLPKAVTRMLSKRGSNGAMHKLQCVIEFTVSPSTETPTRAGERQMEQMDEAVKQEKKAIEQMKSVPSPFEYAEGAMGDLGSAAEQTNSIVNTWVPLLSKVEQFTKVVDKITEVRHAQYLTYLHTT